MVMGGVCDFIRLEYVEGYDFLRSATGYNAGPADYTLSPPTLCSKPNHFGCDRTTGRGVVRRLGFQARLSFCDGDDDTR